MHSLIRILILLFIILIAKQSVAQDIIVLRNGDEVKAKVLEIKHSEITYKSWSNLEGPVYTKNIDEIFMVKYANGTKDVFDSNQNISNLSTKVESPNSSGYFLGTWYHKKYNGSSNKTTILISKALDNFLVEYKVDVRVDEYFRDRNGSFKEIGHLENGSIIINSMTKLSLLNENTILMDNEEFTRVPLNINAKGSNVQSNIRKSTAQNASIISAKSYNPTDTDLRLGHFNQECSHGNYTTVFDYFISLLGDSLKDKLPVYYRNIFYKSNDALLTAIDLVKMGGTVKYPDSIIRIKKSDTLNLEFYVHGIAFLHKGINKKSTAKYSLSLQIEDSHGKEYYSNSAITEYQEKEIPSVIVSIKIPPQILQLMQLNTYYYLSFLIHDMNFTNNVLQGYTPFIIVE